MGLIELNPNLSEPRRLLFGIILKSKSSPPTTKSDPGQAHLEKTFHISRNMLSHDGLQAS